MSEPKEEAKAAAWKQSIFAKTYFDKDLRRKSIVRGVFNEGFDAGVAEPRWKPIFSQDDLPKAEHDGQLVTVEYTDGTRSVVAMWGFIPLQFNGRTVVAIQPLPNPFVAELQKEVK